MNEPCALVQRIAADIAAELEIVLHQEVAVGLGGVGAGPKVNDRLHPARQGVPPDQIPEALQGDEVGVGELDEIAPFVVPAQMIHQHHVVNALPVELPEHGAAHEARAAGNDVHAEPPFDVREHGIPLSGPAQGRAGATGGAQPLPPGKSPGSGLDSAGQVCDYAPAGKPQAVRRPPVPAGTGADPFSRGFRPVRPGRLAINSACGRPFSFEDTHARNS